MKDFPLSSIMGLIQVDAKMTRFLDSTKPGSAVHHSTHGKKTTRTTRYVDAEIGSLGPYERLPQALKPRAANGSQRLPLIHYEAWTALDPLIILKLVRLEVSVCCDCL